MLFSCSVMSNCLQPQWLHYTSLPCPLLSPGVSSNSYPLSRWCHPTISPSVIPFSSCPHSFPASGSFPVSQLFASGGQSIGASAAAAVLPININILSRFVIASLPKSKHLNFLAAVTICSDFGAQENKICYCFHFFHLFAMRWWDWILVFWLLSFKPAFKAN